MQLKTAIVEMHVKVLFIGLSFNSHYNYGLILVNNFLKIFFSIEPIAKLSAAAKSSIFRGRGVLQLTLSKKQQAPP